MASESLPVLPADAAAPPAGASTATTTTPSTDAQPKGQGGFSSASKTTQSDPQNSGTQANDSTNPGSPKKKKADKDTIAALLSLGTNSAGEAAPSSNENSTSKKKRPKGTGATSSSSEVWYWLPIDQKLGEWDVLCGRGGVSSSQATSDMHNFEHLCSL